MASESNGHLQLLLPSETGSLLSTVLPFPSFLGSIININDCTFVVIRDANLMRTIASFVGEHSNRSYIISPKKSSSACDDADDDTDDDTDTEYTENNSCSPRTVVSMGLGWHEIPFLQTKIKILLQDIGKPVEDRCEARPYRTMVLFVEGLGNESIIKGFCDFIISLSDVTTEAKFKVYQYVIRNDYWNLITTKRARSLDSVVLPNNLKASIVQDIDEFLSPETYSWYKQHGIPYKRSYLFYGPPGSGKSSFIQGIAGHYKRNLCFLQPMGPAFTDDAFTSCIQSAPKNALIVLEDVDAFFKQDRKTHNSNCPLTFSGLLNGLDGVSSSDGQIIILTTNFVDRLDEALMRSGRVDRKIEFPVLNPDLAHDMFLQFYPGQEKYAHVFKESLAKKLEELGVEKKLCMADLQQHFIKHRRNSVEVASTNLEGITGEEFFLLKEQAEKPKFTSEGED